jgi:ATP-dependent helicase HrpA
MNLRLADASKADAKPLAMSRDLRALQQRFGPEAERAFAARAGERLARQGLRAFPDEPIPAQVPGGAGVPAYPALVDHEDSVALEVFADPVQARETHARGVRRLARIALADGIKQARKQLPVSPKTGLLYAAIESAERLREDLVEAALGALLDEGMEGIRDRVAFEARVAQARQALFGQAMQRLQLAEAILQAVAQVKPRLASELMGWASGNLGDIQQHLQSLVRPGFLRETPAPLLAEFPRFLKAIALRLERAVADPVRDQARMLELLPFAAALREAQDAAAARGEPGLSSDWREFQHDLEELRVQVFAQELGTRRPVSPKRLARQLEQLQAGAARAQHRA